MALIYRGTRTNALSRLLATITTTDLHFKRSFQHDHPEDSQIYLPPAPRKNQPVVRDLKMYKEMHHASIHNADHFWKAVASELHFQKTSDRGLEYNFDTTKGDVFVKFMEGARTNMAYNCLERNIERGLGNKVAYHWEGNEPGDQCTITYGELHEKVKTFAAVLRAHGVKKGDVVALYLPMIPELAVAMLACARIGALHSVVFAGFSADSLAARVVDAKARVMVTADGVFRGAKSIGLKQIADKSVELARAQGVSVEAMLVVDHLKRVRVPAGAAMPKACPSTSIDYSYDAEMVKHERSESPVEWVDAENPLFLLYTSGSTGKPKGIQHSTAGYMVYAYFSMKSTFDAHANDVYWCTADCGWVTGHSYLLYGPLLNGVTGVFFEGIPNYPTPARFWEVTDKYQVNKIYTSPTATRSLMAHGDGWLNNTSRDSLSMIAVAGEPINPTAWLWLYENVGKKKCAIVDTYWQTETGGHMIAPQPYAVPTKPGSATVPFFGVSPVLVDADGKVVPGAGEGNLCFDRAWPGMARGIYGDKKRFAETYFGSFPGLYFTGDGARRDNDGYLWITGRVDDLMNVSGHLLSTAEIESALVAHHKVAEAAVVGTPHDVKGTSPYAYVTLNDGEELTPEVVAELKASVRTAIGPIAVPDLVQAAPELPKTRSGKIARRILRKIAEGATSNFGDTTTLVDESVIAKLIRARREILDASDDEKRDDKVRVRSRL